MWEKVANQNMRAHQVASNLWKSGDSMSDMSHSLDWGQYGFLQKGDYAKAAENVRRFEEMVKMSETGRASSGFALAKARYIVETGEWKVQALPESASEEEIFANGMSAARTGDLGTAEKMVKELAEKVASEKKESSSSGHAGHGGAPAPSSQEELAGKVMGKELSALIALARGKKDQAVALLREAVQIEGGMRPPNGAANPVKPSHELLGEVLLETGNPGEAAKAFEASLLRMPNRAHSLLGSARAHAAAGDRATAAERFQKLTEIWSGHEDLPGYQEAKRFLAVTDDGGGKS
jgi:tetratricopeptide (TPR) repeat protein